LNNVLTIDALAFGGNGVGRRSDGKAVFVPFTVPGDRVTWRARLEKKRHVEAELIEIVSPGEARRQPACPLFGRCGGCQWQHLDYSRQLRWKQQLLSDALLRHARLESAEVTPTVGSAHQWNYRNRVQFKCHVSSEGPVIGFYRRGSHYVIPVESCPIAHTEINQSLAFLRELLETSPTPERIPQIDVAVGDNAAVQVICHHVDAADPGWLKSVSGRAEAQNYALFLQQGRKATLMHLSGAAELVLEVDRPRLSLGCAPGGFAQVNSSQNRRLVDALVVAAGLSGSERVLDLFCGMGNFSLPLARRAGSLVGVEDFSLSIDRALDNALRNRLTNVEFLVADAAKYLARTHRPFDLVVLDPPRPGAGKEVVRALQRIAPARILYVSCDPLTLSRDLAALLHNDYRLIESQPFDLFPQTYHIESLSLLERR